MFSYEGDFIKNYIIILTNLVLKSVLVVLTLVVCFGCRWLAVTLC
jgi:hypothetical protein